MYYSITHRLRWRNGRRTRLKIAQGNLVRVQVPLSAPMTEIKKPKIITVLGPTAIGKSDLAVALCLWLKSEVISADSRQVYKYLDLGTGKITPEEMKGIPHHMLDILEPSESYSVFQYTEDANKIIQDLLSKKITPLSR